MRKFTVSVNGTSYEVEVEEIGGASAPSRQITRNAPAPAPAAAPVAAPAAAPVAAPAAAPVAAPVTAAAGQQTVAMPMPGNLFEVKVNVGDVVKEGQVVAILEAMKMENEIFAPCNGKVLSINLTKGAAVNTGDVLCVIG